MSTVALEDDIRAGCEALPIELPVGTGEKLARYLALLSRWNRAFNLTSVRDPREMVARHILDSLAVAVHLRGPRMLDVGSGAGLPGIPLALAFPDWSIVLLDANAKRTRFLTQARAELDLQWVAVEHCRVEHYRPSEPFDTVISRAFASSEELVRRVAGFSARDGRIVAMQGRDDSAVAAEGWQATSHRILVPGLDAKRHALVFQRSTECR